MTHQLEHFRSQIDDFMGHHPQSPLDADERSDFTGLNYYDFNPALVVSGEVTRFAQNEPLIEMQTSTGDRRRYRRWGLFTFAVAGETASLVIYADPYQGDLFLPFKDVTNGKETYGAGRYLDSHRPGLAVLSETEIEIDFNFSYNPYCAYNAGFSCPLPPRENWLKVPIRAGEKTYQK